MKANLAQSSKRGYTPPAIDTMGAIVLRSAPKDKCAATPAVAILFLALVSAVWLETDTYRVASLILVLWGIVVYIRADFRPSIGWMGFACLGWVAFVALRYAVVYVSGTAHSLGTSEGIYLLPAFYMTVGYMMFLYRRILPSLATIFILVSLAAVVASIDYLEVFDGSPHEFLYMNNRIHSSVAAGLIILAAINFASYQNSANPHRGSRWALEAAAYLTAALCFIGLYGAKSKGVWVAIVSAFALQVLLSLRIPHRFGAFAKGSMLVAPLAAFVLMFAASNWSGLGPSFDSVEEIIVQAFQTGHPLTAIRDTIATGSVPLTASERLMLWHNAAQVWAQNVVFGNGIAWLDAYSDTFYKSIAFDIVHNGYLEIGMRYGIFGLGFYAGLYTWSILMARRAFGRGLIAVEAYRFHLVSLVYFFATIITNSNNRLAIGETFMMTSAAFGFYCFYLIQFDRIQPHAKSQTHEPISQEL